MATPDPVQVSVYAALSRAAHIRQPVPLGWSIIKTESLNNGFAAIAFKNDTTDEIVVAYRGTDEFKDLLGIDLDIALQKVPDQLNAAELFLKGIQEDERDQGATISLTGSSAGGALAQLMGALTGKTALTYNAPGVLGILKQLPAFKDLDVDPTSFANINN